MTSNDREPGPSILVVSALSALLASGCAGGAGPAAPDPAPGPTTPALSIVPLPVSVGTSGGAVEADDDAAEVRSGVRVADPSDGELVRLARSAPAVTDRTLRLGLAPGDGDGGAFPRRAESYRIVSGEDVVSVESPTHAGLFYALATLRQLDESGTALPPGTTIEDAPRFGYRGMHLDVARHLFPTSFIKRMIDEMARLKLNAFHWHLTDDQGWRIEIDAYPRLTEVGGWRRETMVAQNFDPYVGDGKRYGGYYTKDEIRDVVAYAAERYVTVIPEIEMPGHATAALAAYPEFSCTGGPIEVETTWGVHPDIFCPSEATFAFLEAVLDEVIELFPGPYVHIGGDEAPKTRWEESELAQEVMRREGLADEAELQSWFVQRIERFLNARGRRLIGWDEILEGGLAPRATVMSWRGTSGGVEAARDGHDVVISPNADLYLDHYQGDPDHEPLAIGGLTTLADVYAFEPVPPELEGDLARHVLGPQANVWSEYLTTPAHVEYMVFPRLIALAEVAWSPASARDPVSFRQRLPSVLRGLEARGVEFRVPPAEGLDETVVTRDEEVVLELRGMDFGTVRYTLDGTDPDATSPAADGPVRIPITAEGVVVSARRFSPAGRASPLRRATIRRGIPEPGS